MLWSPSTPEMILKRLRAQKPLPTFEVKRRILVRWVATGALGCLLPLAVFTITTQEAVHWVVSGWTLGLLATVGLIGLCVAFLTRRRHRVDRSWGLAPLSSLELHELERIASSIPEFEPIILQEWLERWLDAGSDLRGRDLMLVRRLARKWQRLHGMAQSQDDSANWYEDETHVLRKTSSGVR